MERLKRIIKRLIDLISREEMRILPGHIAFFLVLSLVPIITLVGYIASFFHVSLTEFVSAMTNTLPQQVSELLLPFISGKGMDSNVFIFMIIGFVLASNGCHAISWFIFIYLSDFSLWKSYSPYNSKPWCIG